MKEDYEKTAYHLTARGRHTGQLGQGAGLRRRHTPADLNPGAGASPVAATVPLLGDFGEWERGTCGQGG